MAATCAQCGATLNGRPHDTICPHCRKPLERSTGETHPADRNETDELPRGPVLDAPAAPVEIHAPSEDELERLPRRVNNYELLEIIGRGGMGVVYRARHVVLERFVALKLVRRRSTDGSENLRFVAEAQVTGQIEHPNIVPVHEVGADEHGRPYFVMKLVRGRSLGQILVALEKGDPDTVRDFPRRRLLQIFCDVCQAVAFAHSKGVVHRDLKPGNVMIGDFGEVLLMDWGLARKIDAPEGALEPVASSAHGDQVHTVGDRRHETSARFVSGTPEYMSPEQALGEALALQPPSDVYSLGAVLFELLTFRPPHLDPDTTRLIARITSEPARFPPPNPKRPRIHKALRAIALKALQLNPASRYPGAVELMQEVRAWLEDRPVSACPDTLLDRAARLFRRHGPLITTGAAALLVLSVGAMLAQWQVRESEAKRQQAAQNEIEERQRRALEKVKRLEAEREAEQEARKRADVEARAAQERHTTEEAKRRELQNLARAMPLYLHGVEMLQRRQYDAAIRQLEAAIAVEPESSLARLAHFACGEACEKKAAAGAATDAIGHFQAANRLAQRYGENVAGDPRALMRCADISWRMLGQRDAAREFYGKAAACDPQDPYTQLARAYMLILDARSESAAGTRKEKAREALEVALQIVASGNPLWEAHYVAGILYAGQELPGTLQPDTARALQHFTLALDLEPGQPVVLLARGDVARKLGDKALALMDYTSLLRVRPDFQEAVPGRVELLLDAGRAQEALETLDEAQHRAPLAAGLRVLRARALAQLQRWPEVLTAADEALQDAPNDPSLLLLRARARLSGNQAEDAVNDLNEVLRSTPTDLDARTLRAGAYLRLGQPARAEADYRDLLERAATQPEYWRGLGDALRAQDRIKDALEAYATFLSQQPGEVTLRLLMARLLYERPEASWFEPERAIQLARDAEKLKSEGDPDVWVVLAEALMASGRDQDALQQIERAYTRFPTSTTVRAAREKLRATKPPVRPKR